MRVYTLQSDVTNFQWLCIDGDAEVAAEFVSGFRGHPISEWDPPPVVRCPDEPRLPVGDAPFLQSGVHLFSERAANALRPYLAPHGQVLPLPWEEGLLHACNVTTVLPALDLARSTVQRVPSGLITVIEQYVMRPDVIGNAVVFKLDVWPGRHAFATDAFVDAVSDAGLEGFKFVPVWSDQT